MIVTRQCDTEHSHWPFSKYDPSVRKPTSPRMSNHFDNPLSTQPGWQGQYSYVSSSENSIFSQTLEQHSDAPKPSQICSNGDNEKSPAHNPVKDESRSPPNRDEASSTKNHGQAGHLSPPPEHEDDRDHLTTKQHEQGQDRFLVSAGSSYRSPESTLHAPSSMGHGVRVSTNAIVHDEKDLSSKEEEDDDLDDEDMIEADAENPLQPQTAAERTAARRKMKRFRLTHQQTRFLMSEFAKQPHPDAAHRERLSKEIPGLSPRQVQVWFQNRRAKIKRLNADDRDRMIKMRAVPDDFDNIQALHSPYGAVHGLGTPLASPMEFGNQSYAEHMIRPLMVDVRRSEGNEVPSTGLPSGFGGVGYNPSGGLNNSDLMSPLSPASNDRYPYGSQLSTPLSASSRTSNPFGRQHGLDTSSQLGRQSIPPLQPLHLRDSISRARSDSLQSPLRTSMSWKGHTLDYSSYQGPNTSPGLNDRSTPVYQSVQMGPTSAGGGVSYEPGSFSGNSTQSTGVNYSNLQNRSRLRAASATLPLNLDLRNQYRPVGPGHPTSSPPDAPRAPSSSSQYSSPSIYTTSYPSAPLTAPMEFSLPRSSNVRNNVHNYSTSQMSAPIAPPSDFSQALQASLTAQHSRSPLAKYDHHHHDRSFGDEATGPDSLKRKRSFTLPSGTPTSTN